MRKLKMRKTVVLLMTLVFLFSVFAPAVWAEETADPSASAEETGGSTASGNETVVEIYTEEPTPTDTATDETGLQDELGLPVDQLGLQPLPEVPAPDEQERTRLCESLRAYIYGDLEGLGWNGATLLATSRRLAQIARNRAAFFNSHPLVKRDFVRLCDQVVRLNAHRVQNEEIKQRIYRNMAAAYVFLGCYNRAIACLERGLMVGAKNGDLVRDLKYLYRKMGHRNPKVFVNGRHPRFDVQPRIMNGRTMVPLRALAESLGSQVNYNNGQINFNRGGIQINLYVNNSIAYVGGKKVQMDQPARVVNGRTLVPLRFIAENLNANVVYDSESGVITVDDNTAEIT
ncbi:MAG: copper amine oxidase N-terminal domain-containing protein [Bacillota bacterium]